MIYYPILGISSDVELFSHDNTNGMEYSPWDEEEYQPKRKQGIKVNITILSVTIETKPTAKGSYQMADVAYKNNTFQGKVEGKKVMSFGATEAAFKVLAQAQPGETYDVTIVKNDKGYNDWVKMTKAGAVDATQPAAAPRIAGASPAGRSTYETPEERAKKQVYIIRQSSFTNAVSMLGIGAKAHLSKENVFALAKEIEAYVLGNTTNGGGATGFDDLPNFDPSFDNQPKVD